MVVFEVLIGVKEKEGKTQALFYGGRKSKHKRFGESWSIWIVVLEVLMNVNQRGRKEAGICKGLL